MAYPTPVPPSASGDNIQTAYSQLVSRGFEPSYAMQLAQTSGGDPYAIRSMLDQQMSSGGAEGGAGGGGNSVSAVATPVLAATAKGGVTSLLGGSSGATGTGVLGSSTAGGATGALGTTGSGVLGSTAGTAGAAGTASSLGAIPEGSMLAGNVGSFGLGATGTGAAGTGSGLTLGTSGAATGTTGTAATGASMAGTAATVGGVLAALYGAYKTQQAATNMKAAKGGRDLNTKEMAAAASPFNGLHMKGAVGKYGNKLNELAWKADFTGLTKKFFNAISHPSTKKIQRVHWQQLADAGVLPQDWVGAKIYQDMGVDDDKLAGGKMKGRDVWGVSGMFDQYGKDWLGTYTEAQREKIAQRLLDEKLLDSRKGLTRITDSNRANAIRDEILKQTPAPTPSSNRRRK